MKVRLGYVGKIYIFQQSNVTNVLKHFLDQEFILLALFLLHLCCVTREVKPTLSEKKSPVFDAP